jgi:hypothetical protein
VQVQQDQIGQVLPGQLDPEPAVQGGEKLDAGAP